MNNESLNKIECSKCMNPLLVKVNKKDLDLLIKKCDYYEKSYMDLKCIQDFVDQNSDRNGKFATSKLLDQLLHRYRH